jgi:hypothetical protein
MNTISDFFRNLWNALGCVVELLDYFVRFVSMFFRTRVWTATRRLPNRRPMLRSPAVPC